MKNDDFKNKRRAYKRNDIRRKREYIDKLKVESGCADCKQKFPHYMLEFDHTRGEKKDNVSTLISRSWKRLEEEIAKCDVVCCNCHAIRTYTRRQDTAA